MTTESVSPWAALFTNIGKKPLPARGERAPGFVLALAEELDKLEIEEVLQVQRPDNWPKDKRFLPLSNAKRHLKTQKSFTQRLQSPEILLIKRLA